MKAKQLFIIAAIAIPMVACSKKEDTPSSPDYQEITFNATAASISGVELGFKTADAISIFDGKANQKFTATSATSFTGTANAKAEAYAALYPYDASYKRTSGKVSVTIPSAQATAGGTVAPGANFQVAYAATAKDPLNFTFMPALLQFTVAAGNDIVAATITAAGQETIAGACTLELSATPKCEKYGEGSRTINVTNSNLSGTFFAAAVPGKVSEFIVSFTASNDCRAEFKVSGAELKSGVVTDLGTFDKFNWIEPVNPNPTEVVGSVIVKASFEKADFNLIGDGGFEDYPRDGWKWDDSNNATVSLIDGRNSEKAIRMERLYPETMTNLCQACVWRNGEAAWVIEFDARVSKDSNVDFYSGFSFNDNFGCWYKEITGGAKAPSPAEVVENGRWFFNDEQWHHYVLEDVNYPTQAWGFVHLGMWGDPNVLPCWSEYDNVIVYPKELDIKGISTEPKSTAVLGTVTNATYNQVDALRKIVGWIGTDGKVKLAFSDATINGANVVSGIAETESTDPSKIQITKFIKKDGVITEVIPLQEGELFVMPDDVFVKDGKTYMHYYTTTFYDPEFTLNWKADRTGFAVSEDNGLTWTVAPKYWAASAWAANNDGKFSNAAFVNRDGYTYMIGSHAGRDNWLWGKSYAARVADGNDITDPDAYDYWKNPGWTDKGGEWSIDFINHILQGDRGTYDLIWNPYFEVYQLFYRADAAAGIVYRDSKGPDAEGKWYWSGAKLLLKDEDTNGALGNVSVLKVEDDGSVIMLGSKL